jgi:hypothetical protein
MSVIIYFKCNLEYMCSMYSKLLQIFLVIYAWSFNNTTLYYTEHTQNNGAVLIVFNIKTAPFFCVCPVF